MRTFRWLDNVCTIDNETAYTCGQIILYELLENTQLEGFFFRDQSSSRTLAMTERLKYTKFKLFTIRRNPVVSVYVYSLLKS
jgi:hypothetical protein